MKIHQVEDLEDDLQAQCKNYLLNQYSYKDCSLESIEKVYVDKIGCSPPWFTSDYQKVCDRELMEEEVQYFGTNIYRHFDLSEFDGCKAPCKRMNIESKVLRYSKSEVGSKSSKVQSVKKDCLSITRKKHILYRGRLLDGNIAG